MLQIQIQETFRTTVELVVGKYGVRDIAAPLDAGDGDSAF
jgi:hypothetical protein